MVEEGYSLYILEFSPRALIPISTQFLIYDDTTCKAYFPFYCKWTKFTDHLCKGKNFWF